MTLTLTLTLTPALALPRAPTLPASARAGADHLVTRTKMALT